MVAGTTGAGKSVFLNALLVSLLAKKDPDDLELLLIDPKQLEMTPYSPIPHLVLPIVTSGPMAKAALSWACKEMDRRFTLLKELQCRNIQTYLEQIYLCHSFNKLRSTRTHYAYK